MSEGILISFSVDAVVVAGDPVGVVDSGDALLVVVRTSTKHSLTSSWS